MGLVHAVLPIRSEGRAGVGQSVVRREDERFLTGRGRYGDDVNLPGQAHAYVLRSPHAHAALAAIDTTEAALAPGVVAVLTGADFLAAGCRPMPHTPLSTSPPDIALNNTDGSPIAWPDQMPLAVDRVRFVGEPVALVVGETLAAAKDAAELIAVDYRPLPAVTAAAAAALPDAPRLWDRPNVVVDAMVGDGAATEAAFARAAHVAHLETHVQRVTGVPMEPRAALGDYDPASGRYTLYMGGGGSVGRPMSAAITARATTPIPRPCSSAGRQSGSGGRSNICASAVRPWSPISRAAI
jgi:carbon-monoxide dehydrogenase large subunit